MSVSLYTISLSQLCLVKCTQALILLTCTFTQAQPLLVKCTQALILLICTFKQTQLLLDKPTPTTHNRRRHMFGQADQRNLFLALIPAQPLPQIIQGTIMSLGSIIFGQADQSNQFLAPQAQLLQQIIQKPIMNLG